MAQHLPGLNRGRSARRRATCRAEPRGLHPLRAGTDLAGLRRSFNNIFVAAYPDSGVTKRSRPPAPDLRGADRRQPLSAHRPGSRDPAPVPGRRQLPRAFDDLDDYNAAHDRGSGEAIRADPLSFRSTTPSVTPTSKRRPAAPPRPGTGQPRQGQRRRDARRHRHDRTSEASVLAKLFGSDRGCYWTLMVPALPALRFVPFDRMSVGVGGRKIPALRSARHVGRQPRRALCRECQASRRLRGSCRRFGRTGWSQGQFRFVPYARRCRRAAPHCLRPRGRSMPDAELDGTPSEPSAATPTGPKRRGKVRKRHTVGKVLLATRGRARAGHRARRGLPVPPPQRQPRRRSTRPPSCPNRPGQARRRGPEGADQHPGHGLGQPRRRRRQHRRPDRRRRALGHHDPAAPLGRPAARLRRQHPARLAGRPPRVQRTRTATPSPAARRRDVERGVRRRRPGLHDAAVRAAHRRPPRPLRRRRLRGLPRHGRRDRRRRGVHPRGHRRPGARHHTSRRAPASSRATRRSTTSASGTSSATAPTSAG